ncbi:MAG: hypothetical protein GMKNLPBB_00857 [Myxococcota bacterium]|nr:hypothetical protein [Myxococcota bacterium]
MAACGDLYQSLPGRPVPPGDGGAGDSSTPSFPVVPMVLSPDWGRQGQDLDVVISFTGSDLPNVEPGKLFVVSTPDFGGNIFFKSFQVVNGKVEMSLFIAENAATGERRVLLTFDDGSRVFQGRGSFYVLPRLQ